MVGALRSSIAAEVRCHPSPFRSVPTASPLQARRTDDTVAALEVTAPAITNKQQSLPSAVALTLNCWPIERRGGRREHLAN